jgi:YVTN family beta-propeller protein
VPPRLSPDLTLAAVPGKSRCLGETHLHLRRAIGAAVVTLIGVACFDEGRSGRGVPAPSSVPISAISFDAVYVVNGGASSLSVIDAEHVEVAGTIALTNVQFPHHVYISPDRAKLLVAVPGIDLSGGHANHASHGHGAASTGAQGSLLVLDALTGATLGARRFDATNHNGLYSPDGKEIWTAQIDNPGAVLVLDPTTLEVRSSVVVGVSPSEVTFSADGQRGFVANTGSANVSVVDPVTKQVIRTIAVGNDPVGAWQGPNGIAYVDNESDGTLSAIDVVSLEVVRTYPLKFTPGMVAYGPDDDIWVADPVNERVVLFETASDKRVAEIPAGAGAHGIVFDAKGRAYVTNQDADTVTVIDVASRAVVKTLNVGHKPNGGVFRAR